MSRNDKTITRGTMAELLGLACIAVLGFASSVGCSDTQNACEGPADCDDGNECTDDACSFAFGGCSHRPVADGTKCAFGGLPGLCTSAVCEEDLCDGVECDDESECTVDACNPADGTCSNAPLLDGTMCESGACENEECRLITSIFPCSEQGIRDAIVAGGGPHAFSCNGPTTVETTAEIVIDKHVILDGLGELAVDGRKDHRVFLVLEGAAVELRRLLVTNGAAGSPGGGGIRNIGKLTFTSGRVSHCSASKGGGILTSGTLALVGSRVSENTAEDDGGGIANGGSHLTLTHSTVSGNTSGGDGGGIDNGGGLTLTHSTVSGNTSGGDGGGIDNGGLLTATNSTVSGNTSGGDGGGIDNGGLLTVTSSTVARNSASRGGGIDNGGSLTMTCSIVEGDCSDCRGLTNLISTPAEDLKLGPLRDNGGPTETHALLPGSVAIDRIPNDLCEVDTDQRGVARPQGDAYDIGAFELER